MLFPFNRENIYLPNISCRGGGGYLFIHCRGVTDELYQSSLCTNYTRSNITEQEKLAELGEKILLVAKFKMYKIKIGK